MGSYKTQMSPEKIWIRLLILNCYIFKQNPFPGLIILPTRHWCVRQWAVAAVFVFMTVTHSYHYCCCVSQVHKEYSKCLRHSYCCSRTSTSSSHGSLKNSGLRTNNRYYSSSQTRHAAAHRQVRHSANLFTKITFHTLRGAHKDVMHFLKYDSLPRFKSQLKLHLLKTAYFTRHLDFHVYLCIVYILCCFSTCCFARVLFCLCKEALRVSKGT